MTRLRSGFTTGTCAAAAAKAAVMLLAGRSAPREVGITLPGGDTVSIPVFYARMEGGRAEAAVCKDAGDDPDVTNGARIVAVAAWTDGKDILLEAGEGVGIVTRPGLQVPPGEPAINPVPRRMIREAVFSVTDRAVRVVLSIPGGRRLAERTFNPRLGILGGLSILGTSGIVRPFSCPALRTSLKCLLDVALAGGCRAPVFVPGSIGRRAAERHFQLDDGYILEVGNEWGFMIDSAAREDLEGILILGHPGKLAKLAMGQWDTHSSRSAAALPFLMSLAGEIYGRVPPGISTVEGFFSALAGDEKNRLGDRLASLISGAVSARAGTAAATVLVDMKGLIVGRSGDLALWKSRTFSSRL